MNLLRSPKSKLVAALALLGLLLVLSPGVHLSPPTVARVLLLGAALVVLGGWMAKHRRAGPSRPVPAQRLKVVSRSGLSQRCGIALVEVDGQSLVVVYGDGFAQVHDTQAQTKRPRRSKKQPFAVLASPNGVAR